MTRHIRTLFFCALGAVYIICSCTTNNIPEDTPGEKDGPDQPAEVTLVISKEWGASRDDLVRTMKDFRLLSGADNDLMVFATSKGKLHVSYQLKDNRLIAAMIVFPGSGFSYDSLLDGYSYLGDINGKQIYANPGKNTMGAVWENQNGDTSVSAIGFTPIVSNDLIVVSPVSGVVLDQKDLTLKRGQEYLLTATVIPENALDKTVRWSSDNEDIATVSPEGRVLAVGVGNTRIKATTVDGGFYDSCSVFVDFDDPDGEENGHPWVDLGLPSGIKWGMNNMGAQSPTGPFDLYAWGETTPKESFAWNNYAFWISGSSYNDIKLSKYNSYSKHGDVDNLSILVPADDAATVNWGGRWRMPTRKEIQELVENCDWDGPDNYWRFNWNGYLGTSKKNGKHIFLPFLKDDGGTGGIWSSSLYTSAPGSAYLLFFNRNGVAKDNTQNRYEGYAIRPVIE